jgi:hypothetical protein
MESGETVNDHSRNETTGQVASEQWEKTQLTPELRQWALQQFTEEEILAGLRELREEGGLELRDFLPELERIVAAQ